MAAAGTVAVMATAGIEADIEAATAIVVAL
jgi:hypothetical protein